MNIAIVDDLRTDRVTLSNFLTNYFSDKNIELSITEFPSGEAFTAEFKKDTYDIIFLDIYMDTMNGIDVAKKIYFEDKKCKIIFVTTSNIFATESYEVKAAYYVLKPFDETKFSYILDNCLKDMFKSMKTLTVISNHVSLNIYFDDILYVDITKNTVNIHLSNKTIPIKARFYATVSPLLESEQFIECYKGVVVNMDYIKKISNYDFLLDNGETVPIRKREKTNIIKKYMEFELRNI